MRRPFITCDIKYVFVYHFILLILNLGHIRLNFHCLVCGTQNVGEDGLKNICDHLVYLGINDGGPMYDKLKLHNEDNDENDPSEVIEKLDDSYT